jgi:zinc transport system substrate-binding protein
MNSVLFKTIKITGIIAIIAALISCGKRESSGKDTLIVSISPLKHIVEAITGDDFDIRVLVPDGASPETYSPTSQQVIDIEKSSSVFTTGLIDFETELTNKITKALDVSNIVDLSKGITLIEGSGSHNHRTSRHVHNHGIDPHIWTSPEQLKIISRNVYDAIIARYPDSVKYTAAYHKLLMELDRVSTEIRTKISDSGIKYFIIYHPALTYYARDYSIEQISLEDEGKEPTAIYMKEIAARGRKDKVEYILYQRQFSQAAVESLAADIGAVPIAIDPLAENIIGELLYITDIITRQ